MDMKAKSSLIRKHRKDRLWSQEHLAKVSGLGLRTIQRLESRGSASQETIKALASVFELSADSLIWPDGDYQSYKHKQWGLASLTFFAITAASILSINSVYNIIPVVGLGMLFGLLTIACCVFSSMTVEVNESEVVWYFGPGVFRKRIPLEEIASCSKVKNPLWMGFGIHAFGTGWIYNISGLWGVELELKSGSLIRLGTDEPNYLSQAIIDSKDNVE